MIKITLFLSLILSQTNWEKYYEDKDILISYSSQICDDIQNGVSFEYYIIQVKNKTSETLVVNFYKGNLNEKSEENKIAFVLNPLEIKSGSCDYKTTQLRLFKSENSTKKVEAPINFNLNNISIIEVY